MILRGLVFMNLLNLLNLFSFASSWFHFVAQPTTSVQSQDSVDVTPGNIQIWGAKMDHASPSRPRSRQRGWRLAIKRAADVTLAGGALVALSPLMLASAGLIRLSMGRPVLFPQQRPGRRGRIFTAYKFRTMREATGADGRPLPDAERLTRLGRLIRRASLDELPQLVNVLRGEMSLVGPRPLLVRYLPRYNERQMCRHDVLPGLTGWAQVSGRNATTWDERFEQDLWYVDNWSLALDLKILALTLSRVLRGSGISQPGHDTMPEFLGNEESGE
jgi:lipopolysaccharide/colanic/teichoic acid biosynthesis glycosyltransferase